VDFDIDRPKERGIIQREKWRKIRKGSIPNLDAANVASTKECQALKPSHAIEGRQQIERGETIERGQAIEQVQATDMGLPINVLQLPYSLLLHCSTVLLLCMALFSIDSIFFRPINPKLFREGVKDASTPSFGTV
jgi:hypothetical protein